MKISDHADILVKAVAVAKPRPIAGKLLALVG